MTAQELWNKEQQMALDYQKINNKEFFISQLLSSTNKSLFPKTIIEDAIDNIYNSARNERDITLLLTIFE